MIEKLLTQNNKKNNVIYITYDGLLDPLGGSQILPYIRGIRTHPRNVHILSFEKVERVRSGNRELMIEMQSLNIKWYNLTFTSRFGICGKIFDLMRMYFMSILIVLWADIKIVHARGHAAAQAGLLIKKLFDCKLIFDFRGLWVDERVDKNGWDLKKPFDLFQYRYFKRIEKKLLSNSDSVIVLTKRVISEVVRLGANRHKITVIPCCADFDHFILSNNNIRSNKRYDLGIPASSFVLGYLGSVGGMYMTKEFLQLFWYSSRITKNIKALVITPDTDKFIIEMNKYLPTSIHSDVIVLYANRIEVVNLLATMDVMVCFIKPSYARIASSPTKIAEALSVGIPVIANYGVGDVDLLMKELDAGVVINANNTKSLIALSKKIKDLKLKGGNRLRLAAREKLGLEIANMRYKSVYDNIDYTMSIQNS